MTFSPEILDALRGAEEVDIETQAAPEAPVHRTIIWVMVDDHDRVLIRSVRGARGRWYREAVAHPDCTLVVGDVDVPVRAEAAADADRVAAASAQLAVKYAADPSLGSMLRADVLETTLELLPR